MPGKKTRARETGMSYTAFALADPTEGNPGVGVWDDDPKGPPIAIENLTWRDDEFDFGAADEALGRMGFRRSSEWEWMSPQYVAEVEAWECKEMDACQMDPACPGYPRCGTRAEHEE